MLTVFSSGKIVLGISPAAAQMRQRWSMQETAFAPERSQFEPASKKAKWYL